MKVRRDEAFAVIASSRHRVIASSRHRVIASSRHRVIASSRHRVIAASRHRGIAASRHRGIAASRHRGIAASRHRGIFLIEASWTANASPGTWSADLDRWTGNEVDLERGSWPTCQGWRPRSCYDAAAESSHRSSPRWQRRTSMPARESASKTRFLPSQVVRTRGTRWPVRPTRTWSYIALLVTNAAVVILDWYSGQTDVQGG